MIKALLLCAGLGSRLRPLTDTLPKCLVDIEGNPLLDIWINTLVNNGIKKILINTHYLPEKVLCFIENHNHRKHLEIVHEKELLGTAGTIRANRSYFDSGPFFIAHADNLSVFQLSDFLSAHRSRKSSTKITMMTFRTQKPESCGIVTIDKHNIVRKFCEKSQNPPGNLANGAVYIFEKSVTEWIHENPKVNDISCDLLPSYVGRINTFFNSELHVDIGTLDSLNLGISKFKRNKQRYKKILGLEN